MPTSSEVEALGVAQALYKALGSVVSTRNPDGLRGRADARLRSIYDQHGVLGKEPIVIDGQVVGMLTAKQAKPTLRTEVNVTDVAALLAGNADMLGEFAAAHAREFAWWLVDQGVVPGGVEVVEVEVPGGWGGTAITGCAPDVVLPLVSPRLLEAVRGLLPEGGE